MVVTEDLARRLYNTTAVIGKPIKIDSNAIFIIAAVLKRLPTNTRFDFEYLIPWSYMKEVRWEDSTWSNFSVETFVLLKNGLTEASANTLLQNSLNPYPVNIRTDLIFHPLKKWHLYQDFVNGKPSLDGIKDVMSFLLIAAVILFVASINYINISIAYNINRITEIGVRKALGGSKKTLVFQFLFDSIGIVVLAGIIGMALAQIFLQLFNSLTDRNLTIPYLNPFFGLFFSLFVVVIGIAAGSYPAFYFTAFKVTTALNRPFNRNTSLVPIGKSLIIIQFAVATFFLISTFVINNQITLGSSRDFGYNQTHLVYFFSKGDLNKNYLPFRNELLSSSAVEQVTRSNSPLTDVWNNNSKYILKANNRKVELGFDEFYADNDFAKTMGLTLIAGRDIDVSTYPQDTTGVIINEKAAALMGGKGAVGQFLQNSDGHWHVIGIVKDFITGSPYSPITPLVIQGPKNWFGTITVRLNRNINLLKAINTVRDVCRKYNPNYPFEYFFVDDSNARKFIGIQQNRNQSRIYAILIILICCFGLSGLTALLVVNRTKEIGIRKVLGASTLNIVFILTKDFLKLVAVAIVLAIPIGYWVMNKWLEKFVFRTKIEVSVFLISGAISLLVALLAILYNTIRAANANPAHALKSL